MREKNTLLEAKALLNNGSREKLAELEREVHSYKDKNSDLTKNNTDLQKNNADLQKDYADLTKNNADLQKKVSILYQELNSF